jgi:hypothetical protein
MVSDMDCHPGDTYDLAMVHAKYQIQRRRLYDIVNVWIALGYATRERAHELIWHGQAALTPHLRDAMRRIGIDDDAVPLLSLFPADQCICLTSLTQSFLLLFAALRIETIDLRRASALFSRGTPRYRSTLCKLYQIVAILGSLGIIEKTENPCEVSLCSQFAELLVSRDESPFSIANLLNHPEAGTDSVQARRREFERIE